MVLAYGPQEVISNIAFFSAAADVETGPPASLSSLTRTCRHAKDALKDNASLLADIYPFAFDIAASIRRLGPAALSPKGLAVEFKRRFVALREMQFNVENGWFPSPRVEETLWTAFFLLIEDDGLNRVQVEEAKVLQYARRILLHEGRLGPRETPIRALAIAIVWLASTEDSIEGEEAGFEEVMYRDIIAAFRFPLSILPDLAFNPELGYVAARSPDAVVVNRFDTQLDLNPPLSAELAILNLLARQPPHQTPFHLLEGAPPSNGPRLVDYEEAAVIGQTPFPSAVANNSERFDAWWKRLHVAPLAGPIYIPGSVTGKWAGKTQTPDEGQYLAFLQAAAQIAFAEVPEEELPDLALYCSRYMFINIQEHYCYSEQGMVPWNGPNGSLLNAWLPPSAVWTVEAGTLTAYFDGNAEDKYYYETYDPQQGPVEGVIRDIIVTGTMEDRHARVWPAFKFIGRIRQSDGYVVVRQESTDETLGKVIFRGYLHGDSHFAGRWRDSSTPLANYGVEGPFGLRKYDVI